MSDSGSDSGGPGWDAPAPPPSGPPPAWGEAPAQAPPGGYHHGQLQNAPGAVGSLVCGILGLVAIPLILSIVAVVLGNQSKRAAAAEPHRYTDQLGSVGRILGWIGIVLAGLGIALLLLLIPIFLMAAGA